MEEFHSEDLTLFGGLEGLVAIKKDPPLFYTEEFWGVWVSGLIILVLMPSLYKPSLLQHLSLCLCPFVGWEYEITSCQNILKEWNEENSLSISSCLFLEFLKCVSLSVGLLHLLPLACSAVGLIISVGWELQSLAHRYQGKPSGVGGLAQGSAACGCGRRLDKPPCLLQCCWGKRFVTLLIIKCRYSCTVRTSENANWRTFTCKVKICSSDSFR